ncbi:MAG: D-2-hydroxyacid dehydrogenase [Rhodoferax sp.]|uniref:D-2-hydroxyacid dehydrogenase n=1 Tax=Rhodoferax sp. TaxID=50421 RepID=UPI0027303415|nr:D-2-hydroxyacid dehydrogenase [Rhodoferax sp.]MDP1531928.1 D-2-hydroxyacid dehydrogenase [Rhodoferax sp.]MDP1945843.1 D-2-hydroxyacid dehydrogenase [Rhodoferax sp.]
MTELSVVLHHKLPPGVADFVRSIPGLTLHAPADDEGVASALRQGAEVLVTYTWRPDFLAPGLKWIAGCGAGIEQYPLASLQAQGVTLTTAAGVHAECVAEHAFALMLALTRRIGESVRNMTRAHWVALPGEELGGKKLAIVGLGSIGEGVARRAQAWGLDMVGIKRNPANYTGCLTDVRPPEALPEVCAWADIVMLCLPALPGGRVLIGKAELERLGAGWLVNVGRGSLVDETALVDALQQGRLRGAGLDVTQVEPLPASSPLWADPCVVLSAHNAGDSPGFGPRWGTIFAHNLDVFRHGGVWRNAVAANGALT